MDGLIARPLRLPLPRHSLRGAADERLVAQLRGSDQAAARTAFEALYDRHHRGILAYCRQLLGSQEEAEDAVQHTFSSAYRALLRDNRDIAVRAWLYTIARNRCLSILAARREQVGLDSVEAVLPTTVGLAAEVEQRTDLRELLADVQQLPEEQRSALVLSELEAHSHAEIAEILGVAPRKVRALVFQAREALMISRQARAADCTEVREQLSVLRGSALRRRELRRHVECCAGCRAFEIEVRRQRAGMALVLPVAPTLALKHSSLAAAFATGGTGAAAGTAAMGGSTLAAGGLFVGSKVVVAKALVALAVITGAGGGGYVAVNEIVRDSDAVPPAKVGSPVASVPNSAHASPAAAAATAGALPSSRPPGATVSEHARERAREKKQAKLAAAKKAKKAKKAAAATAASGKAKSGGAAKPPKASAGKSSTPPKKDSASNPAGGKADGANVVPPTPQVAPKEPKERPVGGPVTPRTGR